MESADHNSERKSLTSQARQFRVENVEGVYAVLDQDEVIYGRYKSKSEARESLDGWNEYYKE